MPTKTVSPSPTARSSRRLSQQKLDGILKGTWQARTQDKGLQHFNVVAKPIEKTVKPVIVQPTREPRDWFFLKLTLTVVALAVGLIALNIFGWPLLDKVASR